MPTLEQLKQLAVTIVPGSRWQHIESGDVYLVVAVANTESTRGDFIPTVIYRSDASLHLWARPVDIFLQRYRQVYETTNDWW